MHDPQHLSGVFALWFIVPLAPLALFCLAMWLWRFEGIHISSSGTLSFDRPKGSPIARQMPDPYGLSFLAPLQTHLDLALDSDGDGWPDWLEGRFGTDPLSAAATPDGLTSHFLLKVSLDAPPAAPGVLAVGGRRVLVAGAGAWDFWLPAGVAHGISFEAPHGVRPPLGLTPGHPAAAIAPGTGGGYGAALLPLLTVEPSQGWCCHRQREPCAVFTAHVAPPLSAPFLWTADGAPLAAGTNRVEVGHDAGAVRVSVTADGARAAVEVSAPLIIHCEGFHEALHYGLGPTNVIYANTDDDDGDGKRDCDDYFVSNEDDLLPLTPFSVPSCCACAAHSVTNWVCEVAGMSDNMRLYATTNKGAVIRPGYPQIGSGQTVYAEGAVSSAGHAADWIDWKYVGVSEGPGGELAETNFTVRTVWTSIDLNDAPVRLEPVTVATNAAGTVVNPAGVPLNGVAVYRVEVVPEGIIPESDIHWSKNNNNVTFYSGKDWGREAYVRGLAEGDFTLEVTIDNMPTDYRPHIHGRVLTPTVTPIHVYIICDANGTPAVSTNTVNAWVTEANRIYRQAAMSFTVASVEHVYGHSEWFDLDSSVKFTELCSYASETGGLEVYCVGEITFVSAFGIHSDQNFGGKDPRRGIAIKATANINTLAHEIGHACGLRDIRYPFVGDSVSVDLSGTSNWSGGENTGYHSPSLKHDELVRRLLMYYMGNAQKSDIAIGEIIGTNPDMQSPYLIGVGLNDMGFREPRH